MKFPSDSPVARKKLSDLRGRIERLGIDLAAVEERFVRCGGPGGQKVNKTASGVQLSYEPLGLRRAQSSRVIVKWTRERSQALNRFLALRELVDEVEIKVSPGTSGRLRERERLRKQKDRRRRRSSAKRGGKRASGGRVAPGSSAEATRRGPAAARPGQ